MKRERTAALLVVGTVGAVAFVLLVPLIGVEAEPIGVQWQSTTTSTEGNQTRTMILYYDWPTESSAASVSYCLWGSGALFQNGTYHPFVISHTLIGGQWCPAIRP